MNLALLLLLLLRRFSRVWLCATPQTAAHQAPRSPGFSRQEHWSRLPFPSSMHEREKWKWSRSVASASESPFCATIWSDATRVCFKQLTYPSNVSLKNLSLRISENFYGQLCYKPKRYFIHITEKLSFILWIQRHFCGGKILSSRKLWENQVTQGLPQWLSSK